MGKRSIFFTTLFQDTFYIFVLYHFLRGHVFRMTMFLHTPRVPFLGSRILPFQLWCPILSSRCITTFWYGTDPTHTYALEKRRKRIGLVFFTTMFPNTTHGFILVNFTNITTLSHAPRVLVLCMVKLFTKSCLHTYQ